MTTFGGAVLVNGPVPQSPRFNLLTAATPFGSPDLDGVDERWGMGAAVWPYSPDLPGGVDPCEAGSLRTKSGGTSPEVGEFAAFTSYIGETCTARSIAWDVQGYADRAVAAYAGLEYYALEKQLMSGTYMPTNPWICDLNCSILALGVAQEVGAALELLEDSIAATGRKGVIHAEPSTVTAWSRNFYVFREGNQLVTVNGTIVVSGYGYLDAHPVAQAAPVAGSRHGWAFATGPVLYQRGANIVQLPERVDQALDRSTNTIVYRAERDYIVVWDKQLQSAVHIDRAL